MHSPLLATLTHARLRVAQGDLSAARDVLEELLAADPENAEARALLAGLAGRGARPYAAPAEEAVAPREPGNAEELARAFGALRAAPEPARARKIRRLQAWVSRISPAGDGTTSG